MLTSSFAVAQVSGFKIAGLETFKTVPSHKEGTIIYPLSPPVGGVHNPVWQNGGIYDKAVRTENVMHSLEHGAVWITYKTDLAKTEVEALRNLVRGQPYTILSPYPFSAKLEKPIYAVAWGVQLSVDNANDLRISLFISEFKTIPKPLQSSAQLAPTALATPFNDRTANSS